MRERLESYEQLLHDVINHCWVFEDRDFVCHFCNGWQSQGHLPDCLVVRAEQALLKEENEAAGNPTFPGVAPETVRYADQQADDWVPTGYSQDYKPWDTWRRLMERGGESVRTTCVDGGTEPGGGLRELDDSAGGGEARPRNV
jgi:hypothetical protein